MLGFSPLATKLYGGCKMFQRCKNGTDSSVTMPSLEGLGVELRPPAVTSWGEVRCFPVMLLIHKDCERATSPLYQLQKLL